MICLPVVTSLTAREWCGNGREWQGSYLHEVTSANSNIQSGLPTFVTRFPFIYHRLGGNLALPPASYPLTTFLYLLCLLIGHCISFCYHFCIVTARSSVWPAPALHAAIKRP